MTYGTGLEVYPNFDQNSDGKRFAFASLSANMDIWRLPLGGKLPFGGEPERVTSDTAADFAHWVTPDGQKLGFLTNRTGGFQLWVKDLRGGSEAALMVGPRSSDRISADGTMLGYSTPGDKQPVYEMPVAGGTSRKICDDCGPYWHWTADRERIVYLTRPDRPRIEVLDTKTGSRSVFADHPTFKLYGPAFSPDGLWIMFTARTRYDRLQIFAAPYKPGAASTTAEWIAITDGESWADAARWSADGSRVYYVTDRDGFRCVRAQELDRATKRPAGAPTDIYHSHRSRRSITNLTWGRGLMALTHEHMYFGEGELTGNVWMSTVKGLP